MRNDALHLLHHYLYFCKMKYLIGVGLFLIFSNAIGQHCISDRYSEVSIFDTAQIIIQSNIEYGVATHYFTGQSTSLKMDVYFPNQNIDPIANRPFILNIHGGGFAGGDKNELASESFEFARRGFVVANVNYRLGWNCDNVICFNCFESNLQKAVYCAVQDARAALRFAFDHREEWGIDENWMFISGESAGSITAMNSTFWDQEEADAQVSAGFSTEVGSLDASGNTLPGGYQIKAIIDQCGAVPNLEALDNNTNIPYIGFHDSNDCVVPYNGGSLIACFCNGFLYYYGSNSIHNRRISTGECSELHTAPQPLLPNHCTYPKLNIVKLSSCFLKRVMCGFCINFADDDINAQPICSSLSQTIPAPVSGCTYQNASNFNPDATSDNGSCIFNNTCAADLNADGIVGVADLITFMAAFGTICE